MSLCSTLRQLSLAAFTALLAVPAAHAHSVILSGDSGTSFSYDVFAQDGTVSFYGGSTISMVGFSGITSVTLSSLAATYGTVSFSDSAIVYTLNANQFYSWPTPTQLPLFTVLTPSSTMGLLYYTLNESTGSQTGTIAPTNAALAPTSPTVSYPATTPSVTPVAATPEPSSLIFLGTGLVGAARLLRRRAV